MKPLSEYEKQVIDLYHERYWAMRNCCKDMEYGTDPDHLVNKVNYNMVVPVFISELGWRLSDFGLGFTDDIRWDAVKLYRCLTDSPWHNWELWGGNRPEYVRS